MLMSRFRTRREIEIGLALALAVCVAALLGDGGGYAPTSWAWPGAALALAGISALILHPPKMGRFELASIITSVCSSPGRGIAAHGLGIAPTACMRLKETSCIWLRFSRYAWCCDTFGRQRHWQVRTPQSFWVATYGVANRVFPDQLGVSGDPLAAGRLFVPVGYSNAEGLAAAFGMILGVGLASRSSGKSAALAASPLPLTRCGLRVHRK